jgi:predicted dehydrogenase
MIRFGILGTASIARAFFDRPLENARITAVASRDKEKADAFADQFKIPGRFGSYDALLADPDIDAVYIPLPQHLHCEYTVKAAKAGKHVLVEKPAALSSAEARTMVAACRKNDVFLMEAFMYRFKRIHLRVKEIVDSGLIGDLRYVDFNWCFNIGHLVRSPFRMQKKMGGGALYDLGIYGIDFLRYLTGIDPTVVGSYLRRDHPGGVDLFAHVVFTVGAVTGAVTCGFTTDANYYVLNGTLGSLHVPGSLSGRAVKNTIHIHLLQGDKRYEETFAAENPYILEMEYFARCITKKERPLPDGENSVHNLKILERVFTRAVKM